MKLLIALSCLVVAFALPSSPSFGYRNNERNKINELDLSHEDLQSNDLIKAYEQLIGNIGGLSRVDEEEDIVNNIVEAIIAIGQIIRDTAAGENRLPRPHRPGKEEGSNIHNITRPAANATERPDHINIHNVTRPAANETERPDDINIHNVTRPAANTTERPDDINIHNTTRPAANATERPDDINIHNVTRPAANATERPDDINIHNITRPASNATERPDDINIHNVTRPAANATERPTEIPTGRPTGRPTETPSADEINTGSPEITTEIPSSPEYISSGSNEINEDSLDDEREEETYFINEPIIERRYRFPSVYEMNENLPYIANNI